MINSTYGSIGFNFRFTDILASIGIEQLKRLPERIERVKAIYAKYASVMNNFSFLKIIPVNVEKGEIPIFVEIICQYRHELMEFLLRNAIQTRPFYPDLDSADYIDSDHDFDNSRKFGEQGLYLPSGPDQPIENIELVLKAMRLFADKL